MDDDQKEVDLGSEIGMVPIQVAYEMLGVENMRLYYDPGKKAIMIEAKIGKAIGSSLSGKSVVFSGTTRGAIRVGDLDKRAPRDLRLMVSVYIPKPPGLMAAREKKAKEVLEARLLRGEKA